MILNSLLKLLYYFEENLCTASHTPVGLLGSVPVAIRSCIVTRNAIIIASKSPSCRVQQAPFWRGDRTAVCCKEGKAWAAPAVKAGGGGGNWSFSNKGTEGTAVLRASCVFCSTPLGSAFSGPPSDGISLSSSLPSELSGIWRGSKTDFISAQVNQIDTGKGTPLQRGFSNSLSTFSHVRKSKEKGTIISVSQWFVTAPIAGPHLLLFPLLSKAAFCSQLSEFPRPVSMPERVSFTAKGGFQRPHPTLLQDQAPPIFQLQFLSQRSFTSQPRVGRQLLQWAQQVGIQSGQQPTRHSLGKRI